MILSGMHILDFVPTEWIVKESGLFDYPKRKNESPSHRKKYGTSQRENPKIREGDCHGIEGCWTKDTLQLLDQLMGSDSFFNKHGSQHQNRKKDQLICVFGGPYILGQKEDDLKLVLGSPHTSLTSRICTAKNIIYAIIHLSHAPIPGFNTLVFGYTGKFGPINEQLHTLVGLICSLYVSS